MKVLVVDDEALTCKVIYNKLSKAGFDVSVCNDGQEALNILKSSTPDLIISDLMMPYISGIELLTKVKNEIPKHIYVMLISSLHKNEIISTVLELGADDFIAKPIKPKELLLRVQKIESKWKKKNLIAA